MKILLFIITILFQASYACNLHYRGNSIYELSNWSELEESLSTIVKNSTKTPETIIFDLSNRESLVEITKSTYAKNPKIFSSELKSKEYIYWKSLVRDNNKVISVYINNEDGKSEKLASFIVKKEEEDFYINYQFNRESLAVYDLEMARALQEYKKENLQRGFYTLYEVPSGLLAADNFQRDNAVLIKNLLASSRGERVLGLARDNLRSSFVSFEGYSSGIVHELGIDYLKVRVDGEDFKFSLINVFSLQTAVY